jgi:hypothetical protein
VGMMYVLILIGYSQLSNPPSMAMMEFNSLETCQAALKKVEGRYGYGSGIKGMCVTK